MVLPALFLPLAVRFGFTDEKLVALLVMLGSITPRRATLWQSRWATKVCLPAACALPPTLFSAFSLTFWLFVLRSLGYIL